MTMTKAEIAEYVAQRKQAGLLIDPETAEVEWWRANEQDPYAIGEDPEEMGCSNKCHFVRAPGSDMWIYLGDLPEATIKVFRSDGRESGPRIMRLCGSKNENETHELPAADLGAAGERADLSHRRLHAQLSACERSECAQLQTPALGADGEMRASTMKLYRVRTTAKEYHGYRDVVFHWFGHPMPQGQRPYADLIKDYEPRDRDAVYVEAYIEELFTWDEADS